MTVIRIKSVESSAAAAGRFLFVRLLAVVEVNHEVQCGPHWGRLGTGVDLEFALQSCWNGHLLTPTCGFELKLNTAEPQ